MGGYSLSQETTKYKDQAEHLKKLFNEVQQSESKEVKKGKPPLNPEHSQDVKVDVLNLPPRKEVHGKSLDRARLKFRKPLLRFLTVITILVMIIIGAYFIWNEELISIIKDLK